MKRENFLIDKIADFQNLRLAYLKAARGKRNSLSFILFNIHLDYRLREIQSLILSGTYQVEEYNFFKIYDPKERLISAASFRDRIVHHAVINVLEPVFERQFVFHCYACRKGKGLHKAVLYAFKKAKSCKYFLKLDVRKYFDSINHSILKNKLIRIIKDKKCLELLFKIIDSYSSNADNNCKTGLPIGNLTSQFFANLYLSSLDHFILEKLKPEGYARYMDDMVLFYNDRNLLKEHLVMINDFCSEKLYLNLKESVFSKCSLGIPFLGYKITDKGIAFLRKSKIRMKRKLSDIDSDYRNKKISEQKAYDIFSAVYQRSNLLC